MSFLSSYKKSQMKITFLFFLSSYLIKLAETYIQKQCKQKCVLIFLKLFNLKKNVWNLRLLIIQYLVANNYFLNFSL